MNAEHQTSGARVLVPVRKDPAAIHELAQPVGIVQCAHSSHAAAGEDTRAPSARPASPAPQTLDLALQQLHDTLKKCGAAECENLIKGAETGYAQFVAALEKISKLALDWEKHRKGEAEHASAKAAGYSEQTEFELEQRIEGSPPKPQ